MVVIMWNSVIVLCLVVLIKNGCDGLSLGYNSPRVCVIGAGYSGLATARYMRQYGLNFTVFEATKYIGGNWRFDPHIGEDEDGLPVFTSMYKGLRTNTPRQFMEFKDYPMSDKLSMFPPALCFYNYILSFSKHFNLEDYIQFRSLVTSIKWDVDHWDLTYVKTESKTKAKEKCDFVVVATGYFGKPVVPKFEGQENFKGSIIHSHDYKHERPFVGRKVVIVGDGPSGIDITLLLANYTSKLILSHHHSTTVDYVPENVIIKPDIRLFKSNGIVFKDGSFEQVDVVILCTGFNFNHPFLDESVGLAITPKLLMPLYNFVVNIKNPSMMFVGKTKVSILSTYDAQAEYAALLAANKISLPAEETMVQNWLNDVYTLLTNSLSINDVNAVTNFERYFTRLADEAGVRRPLPNLDNWSRDSYSREEICPAVILIKFLFCLIDFFIFLNIKDFRATLTLEEFRFKIN